MAAAFTPPAAEEPVDASPADAPRQPPLLGILGGMGPLATADFLENLTRLTRAGRDQDHLPWLTLSQPGIPDRSQAIQSGSDAPRRYLTQGVAYLAAQGVRLIAIPCNTSHFWFDAMQAASSVPILHIAETAIDALEHSRGAAAGKVAVLATRGTVAAGIYAKPLQARGIATHPLDEDLQTAVDGIIAGVKGGRVEQAAARMQELADRLAAVGVGTVLLACTELPIAWHRVTSPVAAIDTSLALARGCLRRLGVPLAEQTEAVLEDS